MIIGIDLGTTNSLVAVWRANKPELVPNPLGEFLTPSVVGLDDQGRVITGQVARERLQTHPRLTAAMFKRYMGSSREIRLGHRSFRPEELSALLLRSLKSDVERAYGEQVTEAVISVPAYFSDAQRKATRIAGELAGLKVERLINEPTAAALAYGLHQTGESTFLVFDLGGGTFDVSVLELFEGVMEVRASAGDNFLGGEDFDDALVKHVLTRPAFKDAAIDANEISLSQRMRREAQRVVHRIGQQSEVIFCLTEGELAIRESITQQQFQQIVEPLLNRLRVPVERAMRDARLRVADIDQILLVGGATRMPLVRRMVVSLFGRIPVMHLNPDEVVGLGAAVQAALKSRHSALSEMVLTDVCPYSLGTDFSIRYGNCTEDGHYMPIIERNSVVPVSRVKVFETMMDNQTFVITRIYQGESRLVKDNIYLGELKLSIPPRKAGEVKVEVRFTYDVNGLLEAEVRIPLTGEERRLVIENNPGVLSSKEVAERLKALQALKTHPREQHANSLLVARFDRLYQESLGDLRVYLGDLAAQFQRVLEGQDERQIRETYQEFSRRLDEIERDF